MKKTLMTMLIALCVAIGLQAQDDSCNRGGHKGHGGNMDPAKMVEMRVNRLSEELSLTADQRVAITEILTKDAQVRKAAMPQKGEKMAQGEKPSREQMKSRREQMKAHQDAVNAQVEQVLTAEQKAKFAKIKDLRPHRGHHGMKDGKMGDAKDGKQCGNSCCDKDKKN